MKKIIKLLVLFIVLLFPFSCKEDILQEEYDVQLKSASKSKSKTVYGVDEDILSYFQHYCQRNAGPSGGSYPNATGNLTKDQSMRACGPTSYMMVSYCIANYMNGDSYYNVSGAKLAKIIKKTGVSTSLLDLQLYGIVYDGFLYAEYNNKQKKSRIDTKKFIETSLKNDGFVIVGINANIYDYNIVNNNNLYYDSSKNPDLNDSGNKSSNYISTKEEGGNIGGHIIIIIKVTIDNKVGNGVVEYIDPLAQTKKPSYVSNRRYVSYTRLLNSMSVNGEYPYYDALSIGKK